MRKALRLMASAQLSDVTVEFRGSFLRPSARFTALDRVSLDIAAGQSHGLVGESGSGKSTLGRVILGLQQINAGEVTVAGYRTGALSGAALRAFRRRVQCVFQDSAATLDPRMTIGQSVREGLDIHRIGTPAEREERVRAMLSRVGLPRDFAERYPHEVSGGQRQRVNIARSLVLEPDILIADEPVSALDVSVQSQILDLLADLRHDMGLTMLFISHDLMVVREVCETVSVMQRGRVVETAATDVLFSRPEHLATQELLSAL